MSIETKFNVDELVWMMYDNKVREVKIWCITTTSNEKETLTKYSVNDVPPNRSYDTVSETILFKTKADLLSSL